jgi:alkylated DNA repair dioxygenase AlkB
VALSEERAVCAPEGLVYRPGFLSPDEEAELIAELEDLRFDPIVMHGQAARRTARHFGLGYDYERRQPEAGEQPPGWLEDLRARAAGLVGLEAEELVEMLVQRYPVGSTIGWHRDAPAFELVAGVSLGGDCRMRFRRSRATAETSEILLEARSAYVLRGAARWSWQHSIPPTKEERYSITFRSLRPASARSPDRPSP